MFTNRGRRQQQAPTTRGDNGQRRNRSQQGAGNEREETTRRWIGVDRRAGCLAVPGARRPADGRPAGPPGVASRALLRRRSGSLPTHRAGPPKARRKSPRQWASLPHEQRQQMRQQMREQWRQTPGLSRSAAAQPGQWQQLPQEDRSRLRDDVQEHRGGGRGRHDGWR